MLLRIYISICVSEILIKTALNDKSVATATEKVERQKTNPKSSRLLSTNYFRCVAWGNRGKKADTGLFG